MATAMCACKHYKYWLTIIPSVVLAVEHIINMHRVGASPVCHVQSPLLFVHEKYHPLLS